MKAVSGDLPPDDGRHAFEIKWDGMRIIAFVEPDRVRLQSANLRDVTATYPELANLPDAVGGRSVVLDGEVVAFDESGRPNFGLLQQRMHIASAAEARRRAAAAPAVYMVFDLLHLDEVDTTGLTYVDRRRLLEEVLEEGPSWRRPGYHVGDGTALREASAGQGLEGLVAKRLDSRYEPGRRSPAWRKVKNRLRQEFVVGGWLPGEGNREGRLGALLVGYHEGEDLRFAGRVGTGFSEHELERLGRLLAERRREDTPFSPPPPRAVERLARYVEPDLVAEVEFGEWTREYILRHPSYLGLREDKDPAQVVREPY
jgi:bifunctional non-homologous end joining protein LigD